MRFQPTRLGALERYASPLLKSQGFPTIPEDQHDTGASPSALMYLERKRALIASMGAAGHTIS